MIKSYLLSLLVLAGQSVVSGQPRDSAAVAKAVTQLYAALVSGEPAALLAITLPQLSYGHSGGLVENQQAFVEKISSGKSDFVSIDIANQSITVSGSTAIVRHTIIAVTNDGGSPGQVKLNVLLVWTRQKKGWKLLARQAIKIAS